jgi:hypothetical protein
MVRPVQHATQQHARQRKAPERAAILQSETKMLEVEKRWIGRRGEASNCEYKSPPETSDLAKTTLLAVGLIEANHWLTIPRQGL